MKEWDFQTPYLWNLFTADKYSILDEYFWSPTITSSFTYASPKFMGNGWITHVSRVKQLWAQLAFGWETGWETSPKDSLFFLKRITFGLEQKFSYLLSVRLLLPEPI